MTEPKDNVKVTLTLTSPDVYERELAKLKTIADAAALQQAVETIVASAEVTRI